jgi:hypothetical protein
MDFFKGLLLIESERSAQKELDHVIRVVNTAYAEWKKMGRRKNAVDLVTTTANKIGNINPATIDRIHEATRLKLSALIIRCLDIPYWHDASSKEKTYNKMIDVIKKLETYDPRTESGGNVREVIMTRLSASVTYNSENKHVFAAYEPTVSKTYLRYLFGSDPPEKTYKMAALPLPGDFETLIKTLQINHEKAVKKFETEAKTEENKAAD